MKKLTVGLAVLLSGYAANSLAALPTGNSSRCDVTVPSYCGGFTFGLTGLYWRPTTDHLDYALTFPSLDSDGFPIFSNGEFHRVRPRYDWGWKANIGYIFPCSGNDINLTYTDWDRNRRRDDRVDVFGAAFPTTFAPFFSFGELPIPFGPVDFTITTLAATQAGIATLGPLTVPFTLPAFDFFLGPEDITAISACSRFRNQTWDLDFGQTINVGCNFRVRWFAGIRYTRLRHNLDVTTDFAAAGTVTLPSLDPVTVSGSLTILPSGTPTTEDIDVTVTPVLDVVAAVRDISRQNSDFRGAGPEFGIDASYHVGGGFGVVGRLLTSLLVGRVESTYTERLDAAAIAVLDTDLTTVSAVAPGVTDPFLLTIDTVDPAFFFTTAPVGDFSFRHPNETRVVPNIDAKLGLDWTYQFCNCSRSRVSIEAGYMVSHYFNAIDRLSGLELFAPEVRARQAQNISFDGPYIGVQVAL